MSYKEIFGYELAPGDLVCFGGSTGYLDYGIVSAVVKPEQDVGYPRNPAGQVHSSAGKVIIKMVQPSWTWNEAEGKYDPGPWKTRKKTLNSHSIVKLSLDQLLNSSAPNNEKDLVIKTRNEILSKQ